MASLSFSAANGQFESDWFQPNGPFQLDLQFATSDPNTVRVYSDNDNTETDADNYAIAAEFNTGGAKHLNFPVLKVVTDGNVYYKVASRLNPSAASYLTA